METKQIPERTPEQILIDDFDDIFSKWEFNGDMKYNDYRWVKRYDNHVLQVIVLYRDYYLGEPLKNPHWALRINKKGYGSFFVDSDEEYKQSDRLTALKFAIKYMMEN
jgi:hypothetical protein